MSQYNLVYHSELPHRARAVYMCLKEHADKEGQCWPGIKTIASELNLSRSTVKRALEELYEAKLVAKQTRKRKNGGRTSNLYTLIAPSSCFSDC